MLARTITVAVAALVIAQSAFLLREYFLEDSEDDCLDVAIIGGGIGGVYTAWRLRDKGLKISVFEYSDRIGGRVFSAELPGVPGSILEFGAMRYNPSISPVFHRTIHDLGLKAVPFDLGFGYYNETLWYLRRKHLRDTDMNTDKVPHNLAPGEIKHPIDLPSYLITNNVNISGLVHPTDEDFYRLITTDGTLLHTMSIDNFYRRYASREAYEFIREGTGFHASVGRQGALAIPKFFVNLPGADASIWTDDYRTVKGGMDRIPKTLIQRFTDASPRNHNVHLNQQLISIRSRTNGGYNLQLRKTETVGGITSQEKDEHNSGVCAQKVILAIPQWCVKDIDFPAFSDNTEIMDVINSVINVPCGRIFLAYESAWWKRHFPDVRHSKTDLPIAQTYDWFTGSNNLSVFMVSYHDGSRTYYWEELSRFGAPIPGSLPGVLAITDVVASRVEQYLSEMFKIKREEIPKPVGGGMMLWNRYPVSAAWSFFKPGVDEMDILRKIKKPSMDDDVYIASNSWAPGGLPIWAEGTLIAADEIIDKYLS